MKRKLGRFADIVATVINLNPLGRLRRIANAPPDSLFYTIYCNESEGSRSVSS